MQQYFLAYLFTYRSWPSLLISELSSVDIHQLINSECAMRCTSLPTELEERVITRCQMSGCPRYAVILTALLTRSAHFYVVVYI